MAVRQLTCSECGAVWRVLKEATTGDPVDAFNCCAGRSTPRLQPEGKVLLFDLNRRRAVGRGTSGELTVEGVLSVSSDELPGGGR